MKKDRKNTEKRPQVFILVILVVLLVAALGALMILDRRGNATRDPDEEDKNQTILQRQKLVLDGTTYYLKKGLSAYLILGTDESDELSANETYVEEGYVAKMADAIMVLVVDKEDKSYTILQLDRNTMTDMHMLYTDGEIAGDISQPLCCAYYYGHDSESASENTINAVTRLLNDTPIESYVTVDMEAIGELNHIAGGVTVTLKDDFTMDDPAMKKGATLTLTDEQAVIYATGRMSIGNGSNTGRLRRQRAYIKGFISNLKEKVKEDSGYVNTAYDAMTDLMTTNITEKQLGSLAEVLLTYQDNGIVTLKGETTTGDPFGDGTEHEEFLPDADKLTQTVIDLFYCTY